MARKPDGRRNPDDSENSDDSARERILTAAEALFAESGFEATPTSRIAELAGVPKGLVHYYFRRKTDLLAALVARLPDEHVDPDSVVVRGDVGESLRRLVAEMDARMSASRLLSHLLWREADTHIAVREALQRRFASVVDQVRAVIIAASSGMAAVSDVDTAAGLFALALSYRHAVARHEVDFADGVAETNPMDREVDFIAGALNPARAT